MGQPAYRHIPSPHRPALAVRAERSRHRFGVRCAPQGAWWRIALVAMLVLSGFSPFPAEALPGACGARWLVSGGLATAKGEDITFELSNSSVPFIQSVGYFSTEGMSERGWLEQEREIGPDGGDWRTDWRGDWGINRSSDGDDWMPDAEGEGDREGEGSGPSLGDPLESLGKEGVLVEEGGLGVPSSEAKWFEKMSVRGYSQFRYNRLAETNPDVRSPQGDRSIGAGNSFFLRRARMIFSGDAGDYVSYYIQPDFASGATGPNPLHFLQIRDFYVDIAIDPAKEHRFRVGQSKVPYGFENLQSSQNRIALDRNDALNSAVVNERDLGVFYYWAPAEIRDRFRSLISDGLKGSGDYGVLGLGIYNGQTANRPEANDNQHLIARLSYPFLLPNGQFFEPGISGYTGIYTIQRSAGVGGGDDFLDRRGAISFVLYPQPWGLQGEWTWGQGPQLNETLTAVERRSLEGGYLQIFYKVDDVELFGQSGTFIPFVRLQRYDGGRKHEVDSPGQRIREAEIGFEYQLNRALELTMNYTFAERTFPNPPYQQESGSFIRTQLQWNY